MFEKKTMEKLFRHPPLHDNVTAGRSYSQQNKGTGNHTHTDCPAHGATGNGGVPFHAAVKFRFDIAHAGKPVPNGDPLEKKYNSGHKK